MTSIRNLGTPLDYNQSVNASYRLPLNLMPAFEWLKADASYNATYNWVRGTELEDGTSLGNNIAMNRTYSLNSSLDMQKLYNLVPFLKKVNEKYGKQKNNSQRNQKSKEKNKKKKDEKGKENEKQGKENDKQGKALAGKLPLNKRSTAIELTLYPDSAVNYKHNRKTKRLIVSAKTEDGKAVQVKYKSKDLNTIAVKVVADSATKVKLSITAKPDLEEKSWYRTAQALARVAMMVRNVNIVYRNNYALSLPGFMPSVGDMFGQKKDNGFLSPGLDFAFGFVDDGFIEKAREREWLLNNESVATPATTNRTEDLQLKVTLEPVPNLKIDLNASRTETKGKSIQYMYEGNPTTLSGTFTMTTISIGSAFEGIGNAENGFRSKTFEKFCNSLPAFRERVEKQYENAVYPAGSALAGKTFDPANGGVSQYSADVMVPAFLNAYTSMGDNLSVFPTLAKLLPNWTLKYSGLGKLPWFSEHFKSVNISHSYKSVYAVGAYNSFSTFMEYMNGLGFISDITSGNPIPNSMFNVSQVSINEAFSPLLGIDVTLHNNMTLKAEYRSTRVMNLSMTSVQLTETTSKDWVFGFGYKIQDFNLLTGSKTRKVKTKGSDDNQQQNQTAARRKGFSHDMNLRLDLSFRKQAAINRDIASMTSTATSGNNAFKLSFTADYTLSRLLTMSFFLDRQTNTPLLSNNSYPTTTQDFGLSMKFSLTR